MIGVTFSFWSRHLQWLDITQTSHFLNVFTNTDTYKLCITNTLFLNLTDNHNYLSQVYLLLH